MTWCYLTNRDIRKSIFIIRRLVPIQAYNHAGKKFDCKKISLKWKIVSFRSQKDDQTIRLTEMMWKPSILCKTLLLFENHVRQNIRVSAYIIFTLFTQISDMLLSKSWLVDYLLTCFDFNVSRAFFLKICIFKA